MYHCCSNWSAQFGIIGNKPKTPETSSCAAYLSTAPGNSVFPRGRRQYAHSQVGLGCLEGATNRPEMRQVRSSRYLVIISGCITQVVNDYHLRMKRTDQPHLTSVCVLLFLGGVSSLASLQTSLEYLSGVGSIPADLLIALRNMTNTVERGFRR